MGDRAMGTDPKAGDVLMPAPCHPGDRVSAKLACSRRSDWRNRTNIVVAWIARDRVLRSIVPLHGGRSGCPARCGRGVDEERPMPRSAEGRTRMRIIEPSP